MINKLSPELRGHVRAKQARDATPIPAEAPAPSAERIDLLVEFTGDVADLKAVGFEPDTLLRHPTKGYTIAAGTLPVDRLADLAAIDHVGVIEGPQTLGPTLNYSLPTIRGDLVHKSTPSRKGRDVVVGIIDTGFDWRHGAFVDPNTGLSRVLALWDQGLEVKPGESPGPVVLGNPLGVLYSQDEISRALRGEAIVRTRDPSPHGTHVAGIAAGNGAPAACCHAPRTYVGVAPEAELIVVRQVTVGMLGESPRLVRALNYIFEHPAVAGRPVVINISLGMNRGPHDGTSAVELAIDAAVAVPRRAVVVGSGNEGDMHSHATASVPGRTAAGPGTLDLEFTVHEGWAAHGYVDLWYARAGTLHIEVFAPSGATSHSVNHGLDDSFIANPAAPVSQRSRVFIDGTSNGLHERDNNFRIEIRKPASGNLPHGTWRIRLTNPDAGAVRFHAWIERNDHEKPKLEFLHPVTPPDGKVRSSPDSSLTIPSTAAGAITVANHSNKTNCCNCFPLGGLQLSSGQGPVARQADPTRANDKPDLAAPGLEITSAEANACNFPGRCCSCCPDGCCFLYEDMGGTSMAAPHVAGTVALMFEENPSLTRDEILTHLQASATPPPNAPQPRNWWGAGKLNAAGAVEAVRAAGGGGGGPHPRAPLDPGGAGWGRGRMHPVFRTIQARLQTLPEGLEIAAAIGRHFSEVRRLINSNRRVATMWHRAAGPCLLRRLFQGAIDHELPAVVVGEPHEDYLDRWCDLLARYGSPRLRTSLERYRSVVINLLRAPLAARVAAEVEVVAEASSGALVALDASAAAV